MNWEQLLSSQRMGKKETPTKATFRSAFEQDYDRIIFSHPFRRLQDKTQVHPLPEHDFVHTRLTHSLEVSSVGRSLGKKAGEALIEKYPELKEEGFSSFDFGAIVAAASLAHDIGNPPFGHSGESAISDFFRHHPFGLSFKEKLNDNQWSDISNFEGNAQGFRLLQQNKSLQLTYATIATFTKYPCESKLVNRDNNRKSQKKYGFFQCEADSFTDLANTIGLISLSTTEKTWCRHPLAYLVEAADDICYQIIDLEDGTRLGLISHEETVRLLGALLGDRFNAEKLASYGSKTEQIGILRAMAISTLVDQCVDEFLVNEKLLLEGGYDKALTDHIPAKDILKEIEILSINEIYQSKKVMEKEVAGYEVLPGLLEVFTEAVYYNYFEKNLRTKKHKNLMKLMPESTQIGLEKSQGSCYEVLMICLDYISGMTDRYAISLFRKIKGISLPTG